MVCVEVVVKEFPYSVEFGKDRYHEIDKIAKWCYDNLGIQDAQEGVWEVYQIFGISTFTFKYEKDAMLFILKWK